MSNLTSHPSISVVTTLYNGAQTICRMLDSILPFLRPDDEWIVVNDGSSDNGPEIVANAFRGRNNCHLVSQENLGLVSAFNRCLDLASKDYLLNIDSGDYLTDSGLNVIHSSLDVFKPDILHFGFLESYTDGRLDYRPNYTRNMFFKSKRDALLNEEFVAKISFILCSHTRQAIRRSLIGNLRLSEPAAGSDNPFMDVIFCRAESFYLNRHLCYVSYLPSGSISRSTVPMEYHGKALKRFLEVVPLFLKAGRKERFPLIEAQDIFYSFRNWHLITYGTKHFDKNLCQEAQRIIYQNRKMILPKRSLKENIFNWLVIVCPSLATRFWKIAKTRHTNKKK